MIEDVQTIWAAKIRLSNGNLEDVSVRAVDCMNAKALLEQIYGRGSIFMGPMRPDPEWAHLFRQLDGR